jgi:signal transduction histidine kinase
MKIVPTRSDLLLFTTTIVTTAVVMILAYDNWQQVRNANYRVEDSRQALGKINAISSLLRDAETDQRGFLLTGQPGYLEPYQQARQRIKPEFETLREVVSQNPKQVLSLNRLERLAAEEFEELSRSMELFEKGGLGSAISAVRAGRGREVTLEIRTEIERMRQEEHAIFEQRLQDAEREARDAGLVTALAALGLFVIVAFVSLKFKQEQQAAVAASQAKSVFLANVSHELRTPLNAIIGYSEMLSEDAEESGKRELVSDLRKIRTAGRHLLELINAVLDLSKIEAGKMELDIKSFDVASMVHEVVALLEPLAQKNHNTIEVRSSDIGSMYGDAMKIRQSLFNLLSNACKFGSGGTVSLNVVRNSFYGTDWISFSVEDNGPGITEEEMMRLFEPFARLDTAVSRKAGGTGLGLAISRRYCRLMGGDIYVKSTPGKGSTFTMQVPANLAERKQQQYEPAPPQTIHERYAEASAAGRADRAGRRS